MLGLRRWSLHKAHLDGRGMPTLWDTTRIATTCSQLPDCGYLTVSTLTSGFGDRLWVSLSSFTHPELLVPWPKL